jgi:hypothetical protein
MHRLYELKDKLIQELEDYSENGKYSKEDVEAIKYMASAVDHLCNIVERAEDEEYSMAMDGGSYEGGGGSYARGGRGGGNRGGGRSNAGGGSYARNRRRDSMGRYSRAEDDIKMQLQEIMESAPNEQVRMEIQRLVNRIDKM